MTKVNLLDEVSEPSPELQRIRELLGLRPWEDAIEELEGMVYELTGAHWRSLRDAVAGYECEQCSEEYNKGYDEGYDEGVSDTQGGHDAEDDQIIELRAQNEDMQELLKELTKEQKRLQRNHDRLKASRKKKD